MQRAHTAGRKGNLTAGLTLDEAITALAGDAANQAPARGSRTTRAQVPEHFVFVNSQESVE
jgi:hypothetical protein